MNDLLTKAIDLYEQQWEPRCGDRNDIEERLALGVYLFGRLVRWHHDRSTCDERGASKFLYYVHQWVDATAKGLRVGNGVGGERLDAQWTELRDCHDKGVLMRNSIYDQLRMTKYFDETRAPLMAEYGAKIRERLEGELGRDVPRKDA